MNTNINNKIPAIAGVSKTGRSTTGVVDVPFKRKATSTRYA